MNAYFRFASYAAAFASGLFVMWLYHSMTVTKIELKDTKQEAIVNQQLAGKTESEAKVSQENTNEFLKEGKSANDEVATLRRQLNDGTIKLRVCQAESKTNGIQADNSRAVADKASADLASYRESVIGLIEHGKEVDRWVNSCYSWVNR